jgi:hypothetical protein
MRIVMRAGVSSEMMMIVSLEMYQMYSHEQYRSSISSTNEPKREHTSAGILLKTPIISLLPVFLSLQQRAENS